MENNSRKVDSKEAAALEERKKKMAAARMKEKLDRKNRMKAIVKRADEARRKKEAGEL